MRATSPFHPSTPAGVSADPAIRIYTAYSLERHLVSIERQRRRLVREAVIATAMIELVRNRLGATVAYHAFTAVGLDLVLCAAWHEARQRLRVEIDLRADGMPFATIESKPATHRVGGRSHRSFGRHHRN